MLAYYVSQSNDFVFRTEITASSEFTMSLQDMTTLVNTTASIISASYVPYESFLTCSLSIPQAIIGSEYRATLYNSGSLNPIWHGSIQAYPSQSLQVPKSDYENQNKQYISNISENRYIIMT
jgi:hypothetical protein